MDTEWKFPRVGSRRWIAWMLVRLAAKLDYTEHEQSIVLTTPADEEVARFNVIADAYGCGIVSGPNQLGMGFHDRLRIRYEFDGPTIGAEV